MKQYLKRERHYNAISYNFVINFNYANKVFSKGLIKKGHLTHHRVMVSLPI